MPGTWERATREPARSVRAMATKTKRAFTNMIISSTGNVDFTCHRPRPSDPASPSRPSRQGPATRLRARRTRLNTTSQQPPCRGRGAIIAPSFRALGPDGPDVTAFVRRAWVVRTLFERAHGARSVGAGERALQTGG